MRVVARASISSQEPRALVTKEPGVEKRIERVDRQAQALEDEKGGLVERRRRAVAEGEARGEKATDRVAQPVSRGEERFDPLVDRRLRQGRPPQARRSWASLALAQEVLSRLALQALSVGLLRTFDRPGGPLGGVLLGGREDFGDQHHRRSGAAAGGRGAAVPAS